MTDRDRPQQPADPEVMARVRHVQVTDNEDGQRIDNFLIRRCPGVPRSHIYRLIRKGEVRVDGGRIRQTRKLVAGEKVRIPPVKINETAQVKVPDRLAATAECNILYRHDDFLLVDKPAGVAVHAGSGLAFGLIDALRQALEEPQLELAHRLDRATSGCLLVGRNLKANRELQDLFRQRRVRKRYLALAHGRWPQHLAEIDVPLKKNVETAGERRVVVHRDGQQSRTLFAIRQRFAQATLLDVELDTGRTHQIRVHCRHAGHPLVGDSRYGDNATNMHYRRKGLSRLFLHSCELAFDWQGQSIEVQAPVDPDWENALSKLDR